MFGESYEEFTIRCKIFLIGVLAVPTEKRRSHLYFLFVPRDLDWSDTQGSAGAREHTALAARLLAALTSALRSGGAGQINAPRKEGEGRTGVPSASQARAVVARMAFQVRGCFEVPVRHQQCSA